MAIGEDQVGARERRIPTVKLFGKALRFRESDLEKLIDVLLAAAIDDSKVRNKGRLRWFDHYQRYAWLFKAAFKGKTLRELTPGDIDRYIAQELLGHKTIQMTLRCAHLSPGHQLEAVQRLTDSDAL